MFSIFCFKLELIVSAFFRWSITAIVHVQKYRHVLQSVGLSPALSNKLSHNQACQEKNSKRIVRSQDSHSPRVRVVGQHFHRGAGEQRSGNGVGVRALVSHQCGPGSILRSGVSRGLSLLVLFPAPRGFSPGTPVFPSPRKSTFLPHGPTSLLL